MSAPTRRKMGELEGQVLGVLWDADRWMTPGEVLGALPPGHPVVYSTVMTVLRRLWKKGVVERRKQGRAFAYHPLQSREQQAAARMVALLDAAQEPEAAMTHFLAGLDPSRRRQLRRLLNRKRI